MGAILLIVDATTCFRTLTLTKMLNGKIEVIISLFIAVVVQHVNLFGCVLYRDID